LNRIQKAGVERNYNLNSADRSEALKEYQGFRLSERMLNGLASLDASAYSKVRKSKLYVVSTEERSSFSVDGVAQFAAPFGCRWGTDSDAILTPTVVVERLTACLTKA
jgi:hypothetical protein